MTAGSAGALLAAIAVVLYVRPRRRGLEALGRLSQPAGRSRRAVGGLPSGDRPGDGPVVSTSEGLVRLGASDDGLVSRAAAATELRSALVTVKRSPVGVVVVATFVVVATGVLLGPRVAGSLLGGAAVAGMVGRLRRRARLRAVAAARRGRVIEACGVLASDLRAGRVPRDALEGAATVCPELVAAVSAARLGGDVPAALDRAAARPGASGLRALGAAWRVAEQSGAAFAAVAERVADALRGDEQVRRQVSAGLAGARATARLLAGLPVLGLGLGYAVGAHPLDFLTGTAIGWLCLGLGLSLAGAGLTWIERLADGCEDPSNERGTSAKVEGQEG